MTRSPFSSKLSNEPRARLRRRDGHDAVRQGRLHQQELRRAEPHAARSRRRGAPGVRPRRRRHHRDEHVRRQPHQARVVRPRRQAARDQRAGRADRAARRAATGPTSPVRSARSASASSRGGRPASTRRATTSASRRRRSLDGGVDLFILETFRDLNEIGAAIDAVRSVSDLPIVAQMTTEEDGNTLDGTPPERFAPELERRGATVIGVNCAVGPAPMLETDRADGGGDEAEAVGAAQRGQAARRRRAQHLSLLARVHGVVRAALHPAQRARRRRLLRHDARAHPADQGGGARRWRRRASRRRASTVARRPARRRADAAGRSPRRRCRASRSRGSRTRWRAARSSSAVELLPPRGFQADAGDRPRARARRSAASTSSTFPTGSAPARGSARCRSPC